MKTILLILDMMLACAIVLIVLVQRGDSGGALGIGGSSGGLFSARGSANFLTRTTAALAALFFATSLALAYISKQQDPNSSITDTIEESQQQATPEKGGIDAEPQADIPLAQ